MREVIASDRNSLTTIDGAHNLSPEREQPVQLNQPIYEGFVDPDPAHPSLESKQAYEQATGPLLYCHQDLRRLGIKLSSSTMLRLEAAGKFPKRVRLGAHSVAWLAAEVHEHVANLAAEREASQ